MANLAELNQYEPAIYQLETADPVLGGPDGIDNLQAKQLANRTKYLKAHVDSLEAGTGVGGLVPPGIATQDYVQGELNKRDMKQSVRVATTAAIALNGVQTIDGVNVQVGDRVLVKNQADATQNGVYVVAAGAWARSTDADENVDVTAGMVVVATEGTLQADTTWKLTTNDPINLGVSLLTFADITTGYAPLNSPNFTGTPSAPTPAQFDNDTSLATTAFVQRALGNFSLFDTSIAGASALTAAHSGRLLTLGGVAGYTVTLPAANSCQSGTTLLLACINTATAGVVIARAGGDLIGVSSTAVTSLTMKNGDTLVLVSNGASGWQACGGSSQLPYAPGFAASGAASGYQKLPSGIIVQWGQTVGSSASAGITIPFPIAFPNGLLSVALTPITTGGYIATVDGGSGTAANFGYSGWSGSSTRVAGLVSFFVAIGD